MALSIDALLSPVSEDQPAGEALPYHPDRLTIEAALAPVDYGEPERDTDWRAIVGLIEKQFALTKDIALATFLCRVGARTGSLETIEIGAQVLAGLFETYWEAAHPDLDERKAPCDSFASRGDFLNPLQRVVLLEHPRLGRFTGVDFDRFRTGAEAQEGYGNFRMAIDAVGDEGLAEALRRIDGIEDGLRRADKAFVAAAPELESPNYGAAYAALANLRQSVQAFLIQPQVVEAEAEEDEVDASAGAEPLAGPARKAGGAIESREDVARALDAIADYYRRREPSHPVQLILLRAKAWISLDFMELLKDIAPDSVQQASQLLSKRSTE